MIHHYIFIVGGVLSGVGKGTTTAALGLLLKNRGFSVTALKIDPYLNVDAGTMNPVEHGEVFVTIDGDETDQDIGNYERFLDVNITSRNYMTAGRIFQSVITKERNLEYGGKCVEMVPHVPEEVIQRIKDVAEHEKADITLIEVGGTVGEYQNIFFLEAARMMKLREPEQVLFALVSYLPVPPSIGEMKSKPTQYAVRSLNAAGIQPDFIVARSEHTIDEPRKEKLSVHCNMNSEDIIPAPNVGSIYEVPLMFEEDGFPQKIIKKLKLPAKEGDFSKWRALVQVIKNSQKKVSIAVVGKYFNTGGYVLADAYISVIEALKHGAWFHNAQPELFWLNSEDFEKDPALLTTLSHYDGILIPGGFGSRGVEGKIAVIQYARKNNIPYFGICYGMQLAVVEFSRNVCGLQSANTAEINPSTENPVIHILPDQAEKVALKKYGGTMRLGSYACTLTPGSIAGAAYGQDTIIERHRHRYEVNNAYRMLFEAHGLHATGVNSERNLVEIIELHGTPFFVGVQFHPEFQSRPLSPHPLFREFIAAARAHREKK